jgi:hypothetical protein
MGSRKEYDRTVTDGSWEAMGYGGADDDDREECTEEGVVHEPVVHAVDGDAELIGEETAMCHDNEGP